MTEALLGPAGAVTRVGPAYLALLAEAQVDAAVRHGLRGAGRPAGGRDDGRNRGAAGGARLRHAGRPPRGDLAWRDPRPAGSTRWSAAACGPRSRPRWTGVVRERPDDGGGGHRGATIANYVSALFTVYIALIFLYILLNMLFSFGVRLPYSRWTERS